MGSRSSMPSESWDRRQLLVSLAAMAACRSEGPLVFPGPEVLRVLPFLEEQHALEVVTGAGLDQRRAIDLAKRPVLLANDAFYIRTGTPLDLVPDGWIVDLDGEPVAASELAEGAVDQGIALLECSGNSAGLGFGLISAAAWSGVPLIDLLEPDGDPLIEVVGYDEHPAPTGNSSPGCSWIFRWSDLAEAFLATGMNDEPLPEVHGAPVRLIVPGWYGCCNVKWVQSVRIVPEDTLSTAQMREFASRTHQAGIPSLAADFQPARAELSAVVVRVEELTGGLHRFHGFAWGERSGSLTLHVGDQVIPLDQPLAGPRHTWEVWSVDATIEGTGPQRLRLTGDPGVPQLRLDGGFYDRSVSFG